MIDAPGPWGTGPFLLAEGHSSIDNEIAILREEPLAAVWLQTREDRTPRVRLVANNNYWDKARGPHLQEVVFRNDLSRERALELVCTTEGEVDIVTEVSPADAARVEASEHARLVSIDALRAVIGIINRDADGMPLADQRAREALNLAVDRERLVQEGLFGRGVPLAGMTPPSAVTFLHRLRPYRHDRERAATLWREAAGPARRPLRLAAMPELGRLAGIAARDLRETLGIEVEITVYTEAEKWRMQRRLVEKREPQEWDVLLYAWTGQATDAPPMELHRAFVGENGEFRAGPVIPQFEELYAEFVGHISPAMQAHVAYRIDKFVHDEALALFLCAPQALYAVNKQVDFKPYRSTFELADCKVSGEHWSRR